MAAAVRGGLGYEKDRGTGFYRCRGRRYLRRDADPRRRLLGRGDLRGRYGRRSADRGETGASRAGDRSVGLVFRRTQEIFRPPPEGGRSASRAELSGDRRRMPHGDIGPVRCRRTFRISGAASLSELCVGGESGNWDISGAASVRIDGKFDESLYVVSGAARAIVSETGVSVRAETIGAASLRLNISDASYSYVGATGAPSVTVTGRTGSLTIESSGAGRVNTAALNARRARVGCTGACSVDLNVSGELDVSVTGASRVTYSGDARIVSQSVSRASSLRKR